MKKRQFLLLLLFNLCVPYVLFAQGPEEKELFNTGWRFHKGDVSGGESVKLDDQKWRPLNLPHDWSIEGPFSSEWASSTGYLPGGIGWYRKSFTLSRQTQQKKVFIYFDGVYKNSEVWINGHYLGKRPNGYIAFQYELSKFLNKNGKNIIAVKVDHTKFADSRWYPGSGIYRNVYLISKAPVYINNWGVAFTTPQVSENNASARVRVSINNSTSSTAKVTVKSQLVDPQGKVVADKRQELMAPLSKATETSLTLNVAQPQLWSIEKPVLYRLNVSLFQNGKKTDTYSEEVGIRTIKFDANDGFFMNGKNMKLKGVCIHHDAGALGAAVPEEVWERRLKKLKEAGCNAIRMSHYPHQDYMYDLCDKMGFVVMDEAFDEWEKGKNKWIAGWNVGTPGKDGYHEYFAEWADRDLEDMVLRNRNHPSIIMWSIGNEIDYPNDPYTHEVLNSGRNPQIFGKGYQPGNPPASQLGDLARRLVKVVKANDTTRPVTAALAGVVMSNFTDYPGSLDLVGYNYQEYRYLEDHKKYPDRIIYGSENGKGRNEWLAVDSNKFIFGQFLWTGFDFMGEARKWPVRSSGAGLIDMAGFPKNEFYFRQSLWSDKPMVYIIAAKLRDTENSERGRYNSIPAWNWAAGDRLSITCMTNTEEAELFLNGNSLGRKSVKKSEDLTWSVDYQPGELLIKAFKNGQEVADHTLRTPGAVYAIDAAADVESLSETGLSHIEIELKDKDGNPVYGADNEVTVHIEGPAKLLGLESGDLASHENYKANKRKVYNGKLLAYVQSQGKAGNIKVTLSSAGLSSKVIVLHAK